ncbi:MAG: Ig-like domain-containing protein, partial [Clostridiales Family XIII bacterium]|nr:Ig-like domain-containing protein [Clostridiales Family XIII bacterium]
MNTLVKKKNLTHCLAMAVVAALLTATWFVMLFTYEANAVTDTTLSPTVTAKVKGVTPDNLNVRSGPSTSYSIIGKLKEGASITVTGYTSNNWLVMKSSGITKGYVYAPYVNVPVTGIKAAASSASVVVGKTVTVKMEVVPACATNTMVTWTSSNTAVATVSTSGVVTGKSAGSATITAKTADGSKTATTKITVNPVAVTGVSLSAAQVNINVGATQTLTATVSPSDAANKAVTWTSSDAAVAAVSTSGVVTGKAAGTATITVKTTDGSKTATCAVTVKAVTVSVSSVSLPATAAVNVGSTVTLTPTVSPQDATNKTVTWTSSDTAIATVSSSGVVTGKIAGSATITVKTADGSKTAATKITVNPIAVTGVSLNTAQLSINVGVTATLTATVSPSNAGNKAVTWTSSNTAIATVGSNGVITGKAAGTATITVKTTDGGKTATCKVTVNSVSPTTIAVTGVSLSVAQQNVNVGATQALTATVSPSNATNKAVTWTSSDTAIATVSSSGVVTGKAAGTATITATTNDGGKTTACAVTVKAVTVPVTSVSVSATAAVNVGSTATLTPTVSPSNATNKSVTWTSSNTAIATVSASGVVTGKAAGTATITVKTADGGKTAACKVTVKAVSTLAIAGSMTIPNPLKPGTGVLVKGTVSSNYNVTNVTAQIKTSGGTVKYTSSATPNAKSYDTGKMDAAMKFSALAAGSYSYVVTAKDASGASKTLRTTAFTVQTTSTLALTGSMTIPNPLTAGKGVLVKGTVSSNYNIASVTAQIKTSGGTVKYTSTAKPAAKSYDTGKMDAAMKFSALAAGSYVYVVTANDASGTSKALRNTAFTVKAAASTTTAKAASSGNWMAWPCATGKVTHDYYEKRVYNGKNDVHGALDINCSTGTSVKAAAAGTVVYASYKSGKYNGGTSSEGKHIIIDHHNGYWTAYKHLNTFSVKVGATVKQGQEIAKSDNTG